MSSRPLPTDAVLDARHYAARFRIALALVGAAVVVVQPHLEPHPTTAFLGCLVIFFSGLVVYAVEDGLALRIEEPVSCLASVLIIGFGHGTITPISMIWLVAAAVGVLARGGRVGPLARVIVAAMLCSPIVTTGTVTAENIVLGLCSGALLLATGRVTLETSELLARARYDADHDALTGALSISALRFKLDELVASGRELYVMIVDLDDFAHINKRRGHAAGDALLTEIAHAIAHELGPEDVLARIDGDAMGVIGFDGDGTDRAATLLAAVDAVGAAERVTASIGIARAPRDGNDAEALLGAADVALRIAKRTGKHRASLYAGDPLVRGASGGAREVLNRIVQGEGLWMAVQPIVNMLGGSVHCYEALARFEGGQGPLHWFELAEELGMRGELEIACLRKTLDLLDELPTGTKLTVNLSVPMLCEPIVAELMSGRRDLDRLIVEVTEESLASDNEVMLHTIGDLRDRGVLFAVDDIGAGYSGLGQLATLRPAYLKLDRGLVSGLDGDATRASLVAAMNSYASATDALLIAEGIETEEEFSTLSEIGVPLLQGFLLARPAEPWPQPSTERSLRIAA